MRCRVAPSCAAVQTKISSLSYAMLSALCIAAVLRRRSVARILIGNESQPLFLASIVSAVRSRDGDERLVVPPPAYFSAGHLRGSAGTQYSRIHQQVRFVRRVGMYDPHIRAAGAAYVPGQAEYHFHTEFSGRPCTTDLRVDGGVDRRRIRRFSGRGPDAFVDGHCHPEYRSSYPD